MGAMPRALPLLAALPLLVVVAPFCTVPEVDSTVEGGCGAGTLVSGRRVSHAVRRATPPEVQALAVAEPPSLCFCLCLCPDVSVSRCLYRTPILLLVLLPPPHCERVRVSVVARELTT